MPCLSVAKRGLCTLHLAQVVFLAESREIGERHAEAVEARAAGPDGVEIHIVRLTLHIILELPGLFILTD